MFCHFMEEGILGSAYFSVVESRTLYKEQVPKIAVVSVGKAPLHFL